MSDKRAALQTIIGKLAKLIPLLASDKPGEVLNAVQAIRNLLASAGLDLHDLVTLISGEEKPIVELLRSLLEKDDDVLLRLGRAGSFALPLATRSNLRRCYRAQAPRDVAVNES